jgi:uncharacterized protein (TIGR04222 family)
MNADTMRWGYAMNDRETALMQRLQAYELDDIGARLSFSKRLARDNAWSETYAQRVIEEYKRFAFLAAAAGHPVTPSDQVDQVWHMHLIYSRAYWEDFCPNVLQTSLHHGPTKGGQQERSKFNDWYAKTLESYERFFGTPAPADIWPAPHIRFNHDIHFARVNTLDNWIIPKLPVRRAGRATVLLFAALLIVGCTLPLGAAITNPLDVDGPTFLRLYGGLLLVGLVAAIGLRHYLRQPARVAVPNPHPLHAYEIAYLAGKRQRAMETAVSDLVEKEHLVFDTDTETFMRNKQLPPRAHPLAQAIDRSADNKTRFSALTPLARQPLNTIHSQLQTRGLLVSSRRPQWVPALLMGVILLFGIARIIIGINRERPVGYLTALCVLAGVAALWFLLQSPHRSRYGDRLLNELKQQHNGLDQPGTTVHHLDLAVALFGSSILVATPYAYLHRTFAPPSSGGDGGGDSGSSGGDGGGDGGCGGCGGCGG